MAALLHITLLALSASVSTSFFQPSRFAPTTCRRSTLALKDGDLDGRTKQDHLIKLDSFLKFADVAQAGGHAKDLIVSGDVTVNGVSETRRGRKLRTGDVVACSGKEFDVASVLGPSPKVNRVRVKKTPPPPKRLKLKKQKSEVSRAAGDVKLKQPSVAAVASSKRSSSRKERTSVNGDSKQQQQDGGGGEGASGAEEFDAELEALMKSAEEDSADDGLLDGDYEYEDYDDEGEVLKEDDGLEDEEEAEKGEENEANSGFGYAGGGGGGGVRGGTGGGGRGGKVVAKGVTKAGLAVTLRRATPKDLNTVGTKLSWGNTVPSLPLGSANTHQEADNWVVAELTLGFGGIVAVCRAAAATTAETTTITTMTDVDVELDRPDGGSSGGSDGVSGSLTISSLVVAPSARQRGVAGALVDYVVATADASSVAARLAEGAGQEEAGPSSSEEEGGGDIHAAAAGSALGSAPAVSVSARLPIYKNKAAKKTIVAFFESRGIGISPT